MSVAFQRGRAAAQGNLTPLIDVAFLLIVFFVLVSQIVEVESVRMDLPAPQNPASELPGDELRAVINLVPAGGGGIAGYRLGGQTFAADSAGVEALRAALAASYGRNPTLRINLRADRSTHYRWVQPVMRAASTAARQAPGGPVQPRINLVVVREQ